MKILSIINPVSGSKKALVTYQNLSLENKGLLSTPHITQYPGHASDIIKTTSLSNYEAIVVFGGDGTIHEVINGMMTRSDNVKIPIGVVPLGTGNALLHDLDILTVDKAIERILKKNIITIDLMECHTSGGLIYSFNILGWGIPVTINEIAEKWRFLGIQRYNLATLSQIIHNPSWNCTITLDDLVIKDKITFFMACNTQFTGNGMKIAPHALLDDGFMNAILLKKESRLKLVQLFLKVFSGKHINHPDIIYKKVQRIRIDTPDPMPLIIDGQQLGLSPVEVKVMPKQIAIFF